MKETELALKLHDEGNSCAQAILGAYCSKVNLDITTALKIGAGLGGGIGRRQYVCGAINAGAIILGLRYSNGILGDVESKENTSKIVGEFVLECERTLGGSQCKDLLKIDLSNPVERIAAKDSGLFERICNNAVEQTAIILEKYLNK
ncbi:MAG: C_GCAxxG_C_C family protein [Bacteroidales bacterium]|nr:C_GCAxxG_C_C family protein [Bacteroidales bacterium]